MKLNYFNFKKLGNKILLTNDFGMYVFVSDDEFKKILLKNVDENSELERRLLNSNIIYKGSDLEYSSRNKYYLREIKDHVNHSTVLHIFVVTTACNLNCIYCQANNGNNTREKPTWFMNKITAEKSVDIALQSPDKYLCFEFQGGEPLLNFEVIRHIVNYTEERKGYHEIRYNIVTNLTAITDEILDFLLEYNFDISTSLDGPEYVHNKNRPYTDDRSSFDVVIRTIEKLNSLGVHVGAIQTTTKNSLKYPEEIINTYVDLGFDNIFIRPLTPLGKATKNWSHIGYNPKEFLDFYRTCLNELININKSGTYIREQYAALFLKRIRGQSINFMELRSPCGAGIGQLAYYPDGNIFTCDEGRMIYEMGQDAFCLGNVNSDTYKTIISSNTCKTVCSASILESIPSCCDCVYQPYCGTCPVVNYSDNYDIIEKNPRSFRCQIYSGILDAIFTLLLENDPATTSVLNTWSN